MGIIFDSTQYKFINTIFFNFSLCIINDPIKNCIIVLNRVKKQMKH